MFCSSGAACRDRGDGGVTQLRYEKREQRVLVFDFRAPESIRDTYVKDLAQHQQEAVTFAHWHDSTTLQLTIRYIETPYYVNYFISFKDDGIELQFQQNIFMTF
jgi:hypothetical protein